MTLENPPVLAYRTAGPRPKLRARLIRLAMIASAILVFLLGVALLINPLVPVSEIQESFGGGTMGTPASPIVSYDEHEEAQTRYIPHAAGYLAIFLLTQWLFLVPRGRWRIDVLGGAPLTKRFAIAAGMIAMLLTIGLIATIMEIPNWWIATTLADPVNGEMTGDYTQDFCLVWAVMAVLWVGWAIVFWRYARGLDRWTATTRVLRGLIAGTMLEMMVAAPVHAWIIHDRGDDCYCRRGSYTGVVFGCTAIVWLFGPGVLLLLARERKRRENLI